MLQLVRDAVNAGTFHPTAATTPPPPNERIQAVKLSATSLDYLSMREKLSHRPEFYPRVALIHNLLRYRHIQRINPRAAAILCNIVYTPIQIENGTLTTSSSTEPTYHHRLNRLHPQTPHAIFGVLSLLLTVFIIVSPLYATRSRWIYCK